MTVKSELKMCCNQGSLKVVIPNLYKSRCKSASGVTLSFISVDFSFTKRLTRRLLNFTCDL